MKKRLKLSTGPLITLIIAIIVIGFATFFFTKQSINQPVVTNFKECQNAGGTIAESYPLQCFWNGQSFTDDVDDISSDEDYIGLSEQAAIDKAQADNVSYRVVERDGESFPIDMAYFSHRLNFSIKNDLVYKVERY